MISKETSVDKSIFDTHLSYSNEATPPVMVNAHYRRRRRSERKSKGKTNIRRSLEQSKHSKKPRTDISTHQARMIQFDLDRDNFRRDERNIETLRCSGVSSKPFNQIDLDLARFSLEKRHAKKKTNQGTTGFYSCNPQSKRTTSIQNVTRSTQNVVREIIEQGTPGTSV